MSQDFISGFETGIFVRDDPNAFNDYSCSKPRTDSALKKQALQLTAPMQMMKVMNKDPKMGSLIDTAETFINHSTDLEQLFSGSYDGGDFCSGFIFGRSGSKMLIEIAQKFMQHEVPDEHKPKAKPNQQPKGRVTKEFLDQDKAKHQTGDAKFSDFKEEEKAEPVRTPRDNRKTKDTSLRAARQPVMNDLMNEMANFDPSFLQ